MRTEPRERASADPESGRPNLKLIGPSEQSRRAYHIVQHTSTERGKRRRMYASGEKRSLKSKSGDQLIKPWPLSARSGKAQADKDEIRFLVNR